MTSLLAMAWRRDRPSVSNNDRRDDPPNEPLSSVPLTVAASHSVDSAGESDSSRDALVIAKSKAATTPEGLRPRRANTFIRRDLGLSGRVWETQQHMSRNVSLPPKKDHETNGKSEHLDTLPPQHSSSWSTQGVFSSPPVSTSSFYGRTHSGARDVAQSPHLLPGKARTAVGAIVAMQQQIGGPSSTVGQKQTVSRPFLRDPARSTISSKTPTPRKKSDSFQLSPFPFDPKEDDETAENGIRRYWALNEPVHNAVQFPDRSLLDSPISNASSAIGSPSSRAGMYYARNRGARKDLAEKTTDQGRSYHKKSTDNVDTSFSSRTRLVNPEGAATYDFSPLVEHPDAIVASSQPVTDMSGMSQSAVHHDSPCVELHVTEPEDGFNSPPLTNLDNALLKSTSVNQRNAKEELILSVFGRLQDDKALVGEVETAGCIAVGAEHLFAQTLMEKEGLITGFSFMKRVQIAKLLTTILSEIETTQPEDYLLSPSMAEQCRETHNDLRDAIRFCRTMVQVALPPSEKKDRAKGEWKMYEDVRNSLGIIEPESPEVVRGGDTSVFSLPSGYDDTPMTSNVSLSTTITSALTTPVTRRGRVNTTKPSVNGLVVRRTIASVSSLLHKLSVACLGLFNGSRSGDNAWHLNVKDSVRLTQAIKLTYLELLNIETGNLYALVESFVFEAKPLAVGNQEEDSESLDRSARNFALPPPPPLDSRFLRLQSRSSSSAEDEATFLVRPPETERDLFSPSSEDMKTYYAPVEECYDDLRRQTGSTDYDDEVEERDGAPCERDRSVPTIHPALQALDAY